MEQLKGTTASHPLPYGRGLLGGKIKGEYEKSK